MKQSSFLTRIPIEIGDVLRYKDFINRFRVDDIIVCHYLKDSKTLVYVDLTDIDNEFKLKMPYNNTEDWKILKYNNEITEE